MFWRLSHYVQVFVRPGWELPTDVTMDEIRDEIDLLVDTTEWPMLRSACRRLLAKADIAMQSANVG